MGAAVRTWVNLWDALFGKKADLELPNARGGVRRVRVTVKWLEKMQREGEMKQLLPDTPAETFGQKPDPLLERAATLLQAAHISAVGMFIPLLDRFPVLREAAAEHWDFIMTVAGVFMAATRLNNLHLEETREERLMQALTERLHEWNPDGIRAFEDCKQLFESEFDRLTEAGHETRFVGSDALGMWIVLNVFGRAPQGEEECMLVRATGGMTTHAFFDWWDT